MKKHILNLIIIVLLVFSQSCSDILDKTPLDQYSDATVWTNPELASLYLNYVYNGIGHGFQSVKTTNYTDEAIYGRGASTTTLLNGTLTPDSGEGSHFGHSGYRWSLYGNIQRVNKFIDKIDLVVDAYPESQKAAIKAKTDVLKGEALFLRAYMYTNLARTYGGLVLLNSSAKLSDDFSTLQRSSFEETVSFIVKDCDDAATLLPLKSSQELDRACKEAALALKSRILLFAASDLTAGDASVTGFDNQSPYYNREARFYALVLYDSARYTYEPRPVSLQSRDPLGIHDRRTRITINPDGTETVLYGIDTRNGPIVAGNGNYCGYLTMKWVQDGVIGSTGYNYNIWPYMRYTEVVLNYAEACWELGEYDETRKWVNFFRNRVMLPNTTATDAGLRDALRHERKLELYGEELRWFDLRRWMIFEEEFTKPMNGVVITQKTDMRTTPATVTTTWELNQAMPDNKWIDAIYWMPVHTDERQKAPQLVQNPNYRQDI